MTKTGIQFLNNFGSTAWNPESKTVLDSFTRGDVLVGMLPWFVWLYVTLDGFSISSIYSYHAFLRCL